MKASIHRLVLLSWLRLLDGLRHSKSLRHLNAWRLAFQSALQQENPASASLACRALGFSGSARLDHWLSRRVEKWVDEPPHHEFWQKAVRMSHPRYDAPLRREPCLTRSMLLKAPSEDGEKGVLLTLFEYNWARLMLGLSEQDFAWLDAHYDLVLSTSWSPTDYAVLAMVLARTSGPVFVQSCTFQEMPKLAGFHPRVRLLESLGCDWINPDFYPPSKHERRVDFLMIANWGEFKRHWEFFAALRRMPPELRVVLVGQSEGGRDAAYIRQLAQTMGVPQSLEIHQSLPIHEVARLQSEARVALIFSRREGCCVALVEAMFAGCAVGIRADAHVGPLAYVNEETGVRLRPGHLAEDLMRLHRQAPEMQAARWVRENVSCHVSHEKLGRLLRQSCLDRGLTWARGLALPHWRPYPCHASREEARALLPAYEDLHRRFPHVFGAEFLATGGGRS